MIDIYFKDYIEKYKNINNDDWIILYEQNEVRNLENDIFTFCALIDKEKIHDNDYMNKYDWGFATDSFGKAGFGTFWSKDTKEMFFTDGTTHEEFGYLIALRYFDKYDTSVEINPKFIWYGNLVKQQNGYVDPITDELIIKMTSYRIEVKREYLKDFLCAFNKACVIVFDHRRHFNSNEKANSRIENISGLNYYITFSVSDLEGYGFNYDGCSSIIGKAIISPFKKPRHRDYKYFTEDEKYENFIIDYDENEDEEIEFTCNENSLANFFGSNLGAPHFLTPVFFDIKVLEKYKNDPRNYVVDDSNISFLSEWSIPFNINTERRVSVWLGDLGRIPYEEQKYWRTFNIKPEGQMDSKFLDRQIKGIWTDSSRIESKLVSSLNRFNTIIKARYDDVIFNVLSDADKEIYNTFMLPINYSVPEYQSFLMQLCKLTCESINTKLIKTVVEKDYEIEAMSRGSISQLGVFLKFTKIDEKEMISNSLKKAYNCRNKLSGHQGSLGEYNKIWNRDKDFKFNSVEDARHLLEEIVYSVEYVIAVHEARKDETNRD